MSSIDLVFIVIRKYVYHVPPLLDKDALAKDLI